MNFVHRPRRAAAAIALSLAAIGLTPTARAAASTRAPDDVGSTPLQVRPSKPLSFAQESPRSGFGWKIGAFAVIAAAGGAWFWRKRTAARGLPPAQPQLAILRRTAVGARTELLVVDVEGRRLLLGVTPSAISTLAILPEAEETDEAAAPVAALDAQAAPSTLSERFAAMLEASDTANKRAPIEEPAPPARSVPRTSTVVAADVEGQAQGLLSLRGRR